MNERRTVTALEASVAPPQDFDPEKAERDYPELKKMGHDEIVSELVTSRSRVKDVVWRIENEAHQFISKKGMIYLNYLKDLLEARDG